ncbi:MAG: aminotransferase class III-fold pyridoxal phosphate-dependent enzyme [Thermodesulfobacteriota bacterium]|nr:aminotransferase class III-fold pyridoxal phosphate-dependent enzyme [Thermodesulfobacteriota bacterium]
MTIEKSLKMQARAAKRIPGMCQLLSKRPDMFSLGVWPGYYTKAKGVTVWDLDGNEYLDMSISGIGAAVLGYADDEVDAAVQKAIYNGVVSSLNCPEEIELADLLCELHPWADMVRFARSGGEAMGIAIRIARAHTKRNIIAFCGYHGWQDWYLAANLGTGNELNEHLIEGLSPTGVPESLSGSSLPFRYNRIEDLETIAAKHASDLAAIVMEPIRNMEPAPGFIERVRDIADETGAVFVMDEISAGFRINPGGAHLVKHHVAPDVAVFAKAMGNGYAISAIIGRERIMQSAQESFISSTHWTERAGFVAALATINKHRRENVSAHLIHIGSMVLRGWNELGAKYELPVHVGGLQPMGHFSIDHEKFFALKALYVQKMLDQGILASNLFYVTHAHTEEHVYRYLRATDKAFKVIAESIQCDDIESRLRGKPAQSGFKRIN